MLCAIEVDSEHHAGGVSGNAQGHRLVRRERRNAGVDQHFRASIGCAFDKLQVVVESI